MGAVVASIRAHEPWRAVSPGRLMSSVKDNVGRGLNIALVNGESPSAQSRMGHPGKGLQDESTQKQQPGDQGKS